MISAKKRDFKVLTPENAILIVFAQPVFDKEQIIAVVEKNIANCDTQLLFQLAQFHKLECIIYSTLKNFSLDYIVPNNLYSILSDAYKKNVFRNIKLFEVFKLLSSTLHKNAIDFIALKGIVLAKDIYSNPGQRPMVDIDILVREVDYENAIKSLLSIGKISENENKSGLSDYAKDKSFIISGVSVEVHRKITTEYMHIDFPADILWGNCQLTEINSLRYYQLTHEATINSLAVHLFVHALAESSKLIWYFDIALYIHKYSNEIDNDKLWKLAKNMNSEKALIHVFFFIEQYMNCKIQWPKDIVLTTELPIESVFRYDLQEKDIKSAKYYTDKFKMIPGGINKFKYLISRFLPSIKFIMNRYRLKSKWTLMFFYLVFLKDALIHLLKSIRK